jgi:hypothetical protein
MLTLKAQSQSNKTGFYQMVPVNAVIYRNGLVKARNGSVCKHSSDFYYLTMVKLRIYQSSGFYSNTHTHTRIYIVIWIMS